MSRAPSIAALASAIPFSSLRKVKAHSSSVWPSCGCLAAVAAVPDPVRELLQARLARGQGAVLLLLPVGVVEVLEHVEVEGREDALAQLGRERRVALDRVDDDRLAREDSVEERLGLERATDRQLVEVPRALLAVARDERERRAVGRPARARRGRRRSGSPGRAPGTSHRTRGGGNRSRTSSEGPQCCHVRGGLGNPRVRWRGGDGTC